MTTIGQRMRAARLTAGLTIREIGRIVDAGESQISKWENGVVTPGSDVLRRYVIAGLMTADEALGTNGGEAA